MENSSDAARPSRLSGADLRSWLGFTALCLIAGAVGAAFIQPALGGWYAGLVRPVWHPPARLFGPAWGVLYLMMGTAAWLAWKTGSGPNRRAAFKAFYAQLILNALWPGVFFGAHALGLAALVLTALLAAAVLTALLFARLDKRAGGLLLPYTAWLSFALALNIAYWRLNP